MPFFESFVSANVQSVSVRYLQAVSAKFFDSRVRLVGGFQPAVCLFSKVLFPENVQPCLFNIFMRFVAKFPVALVPIVGGFALCNKIKQHLPIFFKTKRL